MIGGPTNLFQNVMLGALLGGTGVGSKRKFKGFRASAVKKVSLGFWAVALVICLQEQLQKCKENIDSQAVSQVWHSKLCQHEPHHEPER